jgi:DNA helicase HerA-like ATPase
MSLLPEKTKKMDLRHKASHVLVTGRSGTGKSELVERLIREKVKQDKIFIFDFEGEFVERFPDADTAGNVAEMLQSDFGKIVIFDCSNENDHPDVAAAFDDFCFAVFAFATEFDGGTLAVFDELQNFVNSDTCPVEFKNCIERGRRRNLDLIYISQAPNLLHNIIRTQTTESYAFAQADENAVKYSKALGFDADAIMDLPDLHYFHKKIGHPPERGEIVFENKKRKV